jgi:hypothetical protein
VKWSECRTTVGPEQASELLFLALVVTIVTTNKVFRQEADSTVWHVHGAGRVSEAQESTLRTLFWRPAGRERSTFKPLLIVATQHCVLGLRRPALNSRPPTLTLKRSIHDEDLTGVHEVEQSDYGILQGSPRMFS